MKTIFVFLVSFFLLRVSYSQSLPEFAPIGATWYFTKYCMGPCVHYNKFTSVDTATIKGKPFKKISVITDDLSVSNNFPLSYFYLYGDSNYIYYAKDRSDTIHLLADFNLKIGDTLTVDLIEEDAKARCIVYEKGDTTINNITLHYLKLENIPNQYGYLYHGRVLQNIGGERFLFPYNSLPDPSIGGWLRCYQDNNIGEYIGPEYWWGSCNYTYTGIEDKYLERYSISIFSNPANENIIFTFSNNIAEQSGILLISDIYGRTVTARTIDNRQPSIQLTVKEFPKGMYLYQFKFANQSIQRGKFIVQ